MENQITPEQQKQLDKLGKRFVIKSLWTGIHHALMAIAMNVILLMAIDLSTDGNSDGGLLFVGSVIIGLFILRRMRSAVNQDAIKLHEEAKKIIKK